MWDYQQASTNETDTWNITNNFQIEYRFLTYFRVRGNLQYQMSKSEAERFRSPNETVFSKTDADKKGTYTKSSTTSNSVTGRRELTVGRSFGEHTLNGVAGMQFSDKTQESYGFGAKDIPPTSFRVRIFHLVMRRGNRVPRTVRIVA